MTTALIITTYNRPDALELVLETVLLQSKMPDEVIIADDGSLEPTFEVVKKYQNRIKGLQHVWHKDNGFRLAEIRNKAIAKSSCEYLIVVDGDMLLHKNFVETHCENARENYFMQGSRVLLSEAITKKSLAKKNVVFGFFDKGITNRFNTINAPVLSKVASSEKTDHLKVRGCNMAFWKKDVLKVNGFNEDFQGWGREDSEFVVRLLNNGVKRKNLKLVAVAYHLFHPEKKNQKEEMNANDKILQKTIEENRLWCENGIDKHIKV